MQALVRWNVLFVIGMFMTAMPRMGLSFHALQKEVQQQQKKSAQPKPRKKAPRKQEKKKADELNLNAQCLMEFFKQRHAFDFDSRSVDGTKDKSLIAYFSTVRDAGQFRALVLTTQSVLSRDTNKMQNDFKNTVKELRTKAAELEVEIKKLKTNEEKNARKIEELTRISEGRLARAKSLSKYIRICFTKKRINRMANDLADILTKRKLVGETIEKAKKRKYKMVDVAVLKKRLAEVKDYLKKNKAPDPLDPVDPTVIVPKGKAPKGADTTKLIREEVELGAELFQLMLLRLDELSPKQPPPRPKRKQRKRPRELPPFLSRVVREPQYEFSL